MMVWLKNHRRSALFVGVTLAVPLYLFLSSMGALWSLRASYKDDSEAIEPRLERLLGLIENEEQLTSALSEMDAALSDQVYPKETDAAGVAAALQAEARRIFSESGFEVTNSQVLPNRKRDDFDYVAVKMAARGDLAALDQTLAGLVAFRPIIFIESFDVFPNRQPRGKDVVAEQSLTVTMQLLSLREAK